jgi:nitrogen fixation/metabolism regulation signal transduction histidine kinase
MNLMQREFRAREYSNRVKERRQIRATWILTAIEVVMLALAVVLMVAVYAWH